jgi:AcrR family transcriptional regulator
MTDPPKAPEGTAADLIASGLRLFGQKGFAATSTREIAAAARTNVASIAYHFGGKEGLRRACGAEVIRRMGTALGNHGAPVPAAPQAAIAEMEATLRSMCAFVTTSPVAAPLVPFMLREVGEGGVIFELVYGAMIEPMHRRFCALWAAATGQEAESPRTRLLVFGLIGQLLYFRVGRPVVTRRMGWDMLGPAEAGTIADLLAANLHSLIERERRS